MTIVAWGGVGKTALVVEWMARLARDGWRGAELVFDWSFYSQGTSETTTASADAFVAKALEFFGDPDPKKGSPWDKGERLAGLVAQRRTLLVLDGVEPLQYPPGPVGGKLKDPALEALLKGLAQNNPGLCLVTTREPLTDLAPFQGTTAPKWDLEHLSPEAGARLLFDAGVDKAGSGHIEPDDQELKDAAREVGGHALTLQLLGRFLAKCHNGDVRKRDLVGFEKADAKVQGGHAFRMMGAYERWLKQQGEEGARQLAVLHLLGLFDRPADPGCVGALRQEPPIEGLTDRLIGLGEDDWNYTLSNLRESGLIATHADDLSLVTSHLSLDAHPLVREYFGRQLREKQPQAWQAGHRRLYEHLCATTTDKKPAPTLQDLQPLYQAVVHGCLAGMQQEAREKVYRDRILRGRENYSTFKLGAIGSDLAAVACFFERPWIAVSARLSEADQAWLLNEAAFRLRALGRLTEALEPMRAGLNAAIDQEDWKNAAIDAGNLSELELTLGLVVPSVEDARRSVDYADHTDDAFLRMMTRTTLADALFQAGWVEEAQEQFRQAENQPQYPLLYSLHGFQYCDLLLAPGERSAWQVLLNPQSAIRDSQSVEACDAVNKRATQTLEWAEQASLSLLTIALDRLTLARAALYKAILTDGSRPTCHESLTAAVDGLRRSGATHHVPRGLLTRAMFRFVEAGGFSASNEALAGCRSDLDEAGQIAERGSMKLHMADVHLHRARLFRDKAALAEARKLIDACGYHRRDQELADAEEAAKGW